jgi:hypothetical protein
VNARPTVLIGSGNVAIATLLFARRRPPREADASSTSRLTAQAAGSWFVMAELNAVKHGDRWRIQMSWPDYPPRFLGNFETETESRSLDQRA